MLGIEFEIENRLKEVMYLIFILIGFFILLVVIFFFVVV